MIEAFGAAPRRPARGALLAFLLALVLVPARGLADVDPLSTQLVLNGRFVVEASWMAPGGIAQTAQAVPLTDDTGSFWFSSNDNLELVVRVLDQRAVDGHFWVLYGALSDFQYQITITDTKTGAQKVYANPAGRLAGGTDRTAFGPEPPATPLAAPSTLPDWTPSRLGPEFQVNVTARGGQGSPAVAVGPDGGSMIAWLGDPYGVQCRFYDPAGQPLGGEVVPAAQTAAPQSVRVAADITGQYLVVWSDQARVKARIYGPGGHPATGEIAVGDNSEQQGSADVVADPAGGFLVAWPETYSQTLRLQRFSSLGSPVGNEAVIAQPGQDVRLAAYPAGGGFVLAWTRVTAFLDDDVWALRLDRSALPVSLSPVQANADPVRHPGYSQGPAPVVHPDGGFSVVWTTYAGATPHAVPGLFARRYGANGQPAGGVLQLANGDRVGNWNGNALALPGGQVMALWYDESMAADFDGGTFARLYDASWQPLGSPFRVNTYTANLQILPAAAVSSTGTVVTAWTSTVPAVAEPPIEIFTGQDGDGAGVFAQRFALTSCATGGDQLCLGGRFRVRVRYTDPASGAMRFAHAATLTGDTGAFWFAQASDTDLTIKVLDGRPFNAHFWVFYGALSDLAYTITVTDTVTGKFRRYRNPAHHQGSGKDLTAF